MPLSETNKQQSQSIEDLIAQLDAPAPNGTNISSHDEIRHGVSASAGSNSRKLLKGKRMNSNNGASFVSPTSTAGNRGGAGSFQKTNSFGQNSEPLLSRNIISSKKYTKHLVYNKGKSTHKMSGKHSWGAPGCELAEDILDKKDPNYDSEDNANVFMVCVENKEKGKGKGNKHSEGNMGGDEDEETEEDENLKELDVDEFESEIKLVILEYFHNGVTMEVIDHLKCYNFNRIRPQLIAYLIQIALEHNNTCKELTSRLLRDLTAELFAEKDFVQAFDLVLKNINDLILDNPEAPETIGTFIARSIADKIIKRSYIERFYMGESLIDSLAAANLPDFSNEKIKKAVESARLLVNMNDHLFQLSHTWGNKGGFLAVKELSDKINELIQEYHDSGDVEEAIRCLKELNVPHFHHEFVYEALDYSLQKANDQSIDLMTNLLKRLCETVIVTYDQLKIGFKRIFEVLPDISLDVPNASLLMDKILNQCHEKGFVGEDILDIAPNRSRKRFVSEGDGGRFKGENGY